jgi:hypothetical protein
MAGTGAILSLSAIGKQDEYLTSNTSNINDSFWSFKPVKHTNFTLFYDSRPLYRNVDPATNWPFGTTLKFYINPKTAGDILTNCYLKLTLPSGNYCDQVGNAILSEYSFIVGETTVQTVTGDWNVIHDELYAYSTEKFGKNYLINGGNPLGTQPPSNEEIPLYIPLNFFFSRYKTSLPGNWMNNSSTGSELSSADTYNPFFLTCACKKQDICISVTFNPITYFSNSAAISLDKVQLVTEEATLSPEEADYYMSKTMTVMYDGVQRQPIFELPSNTSTYKDQLVSSLPVKAFHWFLRDKRYEDKTSNVYFENRFNFSSNPTYNPIYESDNQVMSDARIYVNGTSQLAFLGPYNPPFTKTIGSNYYKYVVPNTHGYSAPFRNIYTYSFSLNPREPSPSGALDFSVMESSKTYVNGHILDSATSNTYNISTHFLGYIILRYENDFCNLLFM